MLRAQQQWPAGRLKDKSKMNTSLLSGRSSAFSNVALKSSRGRSRVRIYWQSIKNPYEGIKSHSKVEGHLSVFQSLWKGQMTANGLSSTHTPLKTIPSPSLEPQQTHILYIYDNNTSMTSCTSLNCWPSWWKALYQSFAEGTVRCVSWPNLSYGLSLISSCR